MRVIYRVSLAVTLLTGLSFGVTDPCTPNPCGENTSCRSQSGRAVCSCLPGYFGSPLVSCVKGECSSNQDCPGHKACYESKCKDVCSGRCGVNAKCESRNHIPVCSCPIGYSGDPFVFCRSDPESLCQPNPCGNNAQCKVVNNVPTCSCIQGFTGSALKGCRPECESNSDCPSHQHCSNFRCMSVCSSGVCGSGALCTAVKHTAVCTCPEGYIGNPQLSCRQECATDSDCGSGKPVCWYGRCTNPCSSACGVNADCQVRGNTAICSCPKGYTGNPMQLCRPFTDDDYCSPNPCGENAVCQPGYDDTGKRRPVCTCPPGYVGNALQTCRRGDCLSDGECGPEQFCDVSTYTCKFACRNACGVNAECVVRNHVPICACPAGYTGDASVACYVARQRLVYQ